MFERIYYQLDEAASRLKVTPFDLLHAGAMGDVEICVNIYGLSCGQRRVRIEAEEWMGCHEMPSGIYSISCDSLRYLELPGAFPFELDEGLKAEGGTLWCVEFDPPVRIEQENLVVLAEEIARLLKERAGENYVVPHDGRSDKLMKMNQASMKYWSKADRNDRSTHPDNATVAAWLVQQGFSPTLADKAATIIRPEWAPTGRKPEE